MRQNTDFTLEIFLEMADELIYKETNQHLEDWEIELLKCFWHKITYKDITKRLCGETYQYEEGYLCRHKGPELMKKLSIALGYKVTKDNFKAVFERKWVKDNQANLSQPPTLIDRFIYFLIDATRNQTTFNDIKIEVVRRIFEGKKYQDIADKMKRSCRGDEQCKISGECMCRYGVAHISDVGQEVCTKVSDILKINKKVTKENFPDIVKQWQKNQEMFVWKLIQIATSLETKNLTFAEDRPAKMQRSDFYALITLFLLVLVNANAFDANVNELTIESIDFSNGILRSPKPLMKRSDKQLLRKKAVIESAIAMRS